tara:strand:- start:319 stop:843 length:525 start_codon:yes stop_codon:yes gene_type:complete
MFRKNSILVDFSSDYKYIFILKKNKIYKKKINFLKRSENIANIFFNFIKKKKIKIDSTFYLFVNLGPGNLIAIRNSIVFMKMLSIIFKCKLLGFSNYELLKFNKRKAKKVLITIGSRNLVLDLWKKKANKLPLNEEKKFENLKFKTIYNKEILEKLTLSKNLSKKVFPISYSNV